jgi:transcriptional regulator with XRE-family HTH domain
MEQRPDLRTRQTVKEIVADNIRARRHFRGMEQAELAQRMQSLGFAWRRATVSDIERKQRPVSLAEALALALALDVTVDQLLDSRGGGQRGPSLVFVDGAGEPDLPPGTVTALLCPHVLYAETEWNERELQGVTIMTTDDPPRLAYMAAKGGPAR